jgi:Fe-Mn family superoxide dismutase
MPHELPPLPYALDALEPYISRETLKFHHGKHHATYVDKLNALIKGTEFEQLPLVETVKRSSGAIFNNAAQAWNHDFFWKCLTPKASSGPGGELAREMNRTFGSFDQFKEQFTKAAVETFGSGWAWLARDSRGTLSILSTSNAETPIATDRVPILTCDVWEHAYYIDYRNQRPDFLKAFWHVVNWKFAEDNHGSKT